MKKEWTPGGSQTRSKQHSVFGGPPFPQYLRGGKGSMVWAEDGTPYTDWVAGLGAIGLGYGHAEVDRAVLDIIRDGAVTLSLPTIQEEAVSRQLCEALGWPEQVRWVKTGSEATVAAMLIARRATGRRQVVSMGYHGWHEAHLPGPNLVDIPMDQWETLFQVIGPVTAAVIVEGVRNVVNDVPRNLLSLQNVCRRYGSLLILDEMVTGFRWHLGGIGGWSRVVPDLACFGKALGNGFPIACVVGSRYLMKHAVDVSSTFGGEGIGLAAASTVIHVYRRDKVVERLWELGERLLMACPILTGWPVHPVFKDSQDYTTSGNVIPLVQATAQSGHLTHPSGFSIMYAHTEKDVDSLAEAINNGVLEAQGSPKSKDSVTGKG